MTIGTAKFHFEPLSLLMRALHVLLRIQEGLLVWEGLKWAPVPRKGGYAIYGIIRFWRAFLGDQTDETLTNVIG